MLKRGGADFVVMLALIDSTWKFMLVWNGAALRSILLNEIYDLADIHFLQFIAYISASLSIRFQPFFHVMVPAYILQGYYSLVLHQLNV